MGCCVVIQLGGASSAFLAHPPFAALLQIRSRSHTAPRGSRRCGVQSLPLRRRFLQNLSGRTERTFDFGAAGLRLRGSGSPAACSLSLSRQRVLLGLGFERLAFSGFRWFHFVMARFVVGRDWVARFHIETSVWRGESRRIERRRKSSRKRLKNVAAMSHRSKGLTPITERARPAAPSAVFNARDAVFNRFRIKGRCWRLLSEPAFIIFQTRRKARINPHQ